MDAVKQYFTSPAHDTVMMAFHYGSGRLHPQHRLKVWWHAQQQPRLYLAQKDVAEVLPALAAEGIPLGPPFAELSQRMHQRSVWLGAAGNRDASAL